MTDPTGAFGAFTGGDSPQAAAMHPPGAPGAGGAPAGPPDGNMGAKVLQSATFGLGADAIGLVDKDAGQKVRTLSDQYDKAHPLASLGIDLAMGIGQSIATGGLGGAAAMTRIGLTNPLVRNAAVGAGMGALSGFGQGGDMSQRLASAGRGAMEGGVTGTALGAVGRVIGGALDRTPVANQAGKAFDTVKKALAKDGLTPEQAMAKLKADPNLRLVDISPAAADAVRKAGSTGNAAGRALGDATREDKFGVADRARDAAEPFDPIKQKLADGLDAAKKKESDLYSKVKSEVVPLNSDLRRILANPAMKPYIDKASTDYADAVRIGDAPKTQFKLGHEAPTYQLDLVQRALNTAFEDAEKGSQAQRNISKMRAEVNNAAQSPTLPLAQQAAAQRGAMERGQTWGYQFAHGLKSADIDEFEKSGPMNKQHMRIGFISGMENYVRNAAHLPEGSLSTLAARMDDPKIRSVLGPTLANQTKRVLSKEAARARTTNELVNGPSRAAEFEHENAIRNVSHAANVVGHGPIGTAARIVMGSLSTSPEQAKNIISIATSPGGFDKLAKAGVSRNVLDKLRKALGGASAAAAGGAKAVSSAMESSMHMPGARESASIPFINMGSQQSNPYNK